MTTPAKPNTEIQKASPVYGLAAKFNIEPAKLLEVLRGTVIKPDRSGKQATNEEVAAFCIVAQQYGLNPFTREIHAFTSGEKGVVPIVGIDGWTHIVNASGDFDGCEFEEVGDDKGMPVAITCKMHVKGRTHPVSATERYAECKRNTIPWNTMPWRMLRHKAYMQAARYAFGLAGIYDEDEARDIVNVTPLREPISMPRALPETSQQTQPADDGAGTDLAPAEPPPPPPPQPRARAKKAETPEPARAPTPSPVPPAGKPETIQEELARFLGESEVSFDDTRSFMQTHSLLEDAESFGDFSQLPTEACEKLKSNTRLMVLLLRTFGAKK